jgi:formate dehydrogenase major subunit
MTEELLNHGKSQALSQLNDRGGRTQAGANINRRDWLRLTVSGGTGLALGGVLDLSSVKAATQNLKLANVREFTTSCNFCSCGCGMVAAVREGKLIAMEGDYDHIVNRGSLCVKGISMFATHTSTNRLMTPRYRAPGSDHWEDISWDDAIARVAQKIRKTRDATWIATEKVDDKEVLVNRTDAIGFLGGAQNTNEECYLFQKAARLLGLAYVEHQARL